MPLLASSGLLWGEVLFPKIFNHHNVDYFNGIVVFLVILTLSLIYRASLKSVDDDVAPDDKVSVKNILQMAVESILSLIRGMVPKGPEKYLPLLGSVFLYIFIANLLGVIPGFLPPTRNLSGNLAIGITVFLVYNIMGIHTVGFKKYMAHFMGPLWWMAPVLLVIELLSHCIRPISLSLRLFGNINGDHLVLDVFSGLFPLFIPVIFLAFGIFVSFVQAYVFTLLSTIYIGLAVQEHDHGDHQDDHHGRQVIGT